MAKNKKKTAHPKASTRGAKPQTKTAFVLSHPATMPAKEVVAKGKAAGVSLSDAFVYAIRSNAKRKARKGAATGAPKRGGRPARSTNGHSVGRHSAEELLKAAAAELGLSRAMGILQAEHDKVHRLLGG